MQLNKVEQVLKLFGFQLSTTKQGIDPYYIFYNYFNIGVKITFTNRIIKYGILIKEIIDKNENKITAWKFVPNNNAIAYQQKNNDELTETILHNQIANIENQ